MSSRQRLAAALNQHCGGEKNRKAFMTQRWGSDSFAKMTDQAITLIEAWVQPGWVVDESTMTGSWTISGAAYNAITTFIADESIKALAEDAAA